jgi:hypothetical protein
MPKAACKASPKPAKPSKNSKNGAGSACASAPEPLFANASCPCVLARLREQHPNLLVTAKAVRPSEITACLETGELEIRRGIAPRPRS